MKQNTVVLHMGAHKTASSALQATLEHAGRSLSRIGIETMPRSILTQTAVHAQYPELRNIITSVNAPHLILSHEVILGWPFGPLGEMRAGKPPDSLYPEAGPRLDFLARVCEGMDARVIYYIRDQDTFLQSFYIQLVQGGATFSFDEWLSTIDLSRLSWVKVIDQIRTRFPVHVKRYETEFAHSQCDAFKRFLAAAAPQCADEKLDVAPFEKPTNRSLNKTGLVLMIEANKLGLEASQRRALRRSLQTHLSNLDGARPELLSEKQLEILAAYRPENEALAQAA